MKQWILYLVGVLLISCTKSTPVNSEKKHIVRDDRIYPFTWNKTLADYPHKKVEVFGFIWFDTITTYSKRGNYQVYERPNCAFCSPVNIHIENEIQVYEINDSLFPDPGKSSQWRLVKVTGRVKNSTVMEAERIERAEYSYPDYEESGYKKLDIVTANNKDKVYADGIIIPGIPSTAGFVPCILKTKKEKIPLQVDFGLRANEAENFTSESVINIRDQEGRIISGKKVRVYGIWANSESEALLVESIKVME